jgi:hypothetical protein
VAFTRTEVLYAATSTLLKAGISCNLYQTRGTAFLIFAGPRPAYHAGSI